MTNKNLKNIIRLSTFIFLFSGLVFADGLEMAESGDKENLTSKNDIKIDYKKSLSNKAAFAKNYEEQTGARVKLLQYDESNVYVIRTKYGYQTNIVFANNEEVQTISVGDRSLWQLIPAGNRLFIRPMSENITTNMTLITNKHSYEFDLKSVDKDNDSNIYVAKFIYTAKPSASNLDFSSTSRPPIDVVNATNNTNTLKLPASIITSTPIVKSSPSVKGKDNYNYTYSGNDMIAPRQVYDNGKSTFINYLTPQSQPPEIFIVVGGKEFLTTPIIQGNSLIINDITREIILRSKNGEIKVYNESLSPR